MNHEYITQVDESKPTISPSHTSPKNSILVPFVIALCAALIAVVSFFLPYICASEEYGEYLENQGDRQAFSSGDMTYRDMKSLSLFEYAKIYFQEGKEIFHNETTGIFYGVLMSSSGVLSLLILFSVLRKRPILAFILNAVLGGICYMVYWDFTDRGIMPDNSRVWGISFYMLYACVATIALSTIWMFIEKRKAKKEVKVMAA